MITLHKENLKHWQTNNLEHLRYEYNLMPGDYLIDVGSYHREWANEMISRYGVQVECFEALDNRAAWIRDGELSIGGAYYYSSFALPPVTSVKCVDLLPFINREIAVLKMNIEGGEYLLLNHIMPLISNIRNLQVQFHYVEGMDSEAEYMKIHDQLTKTHSLQWRYPFVWESWRRNDCWIVGESDEGIDKVVL